MRTTLKFAVSRREEGEVLGLETPDELDAITIFQIRRRAVKTIHSKSFALAKGEIDQLVFSSINLTTSSQLLNSAIVGSERERTTCQKVSLSSSALGLVGLPPS